MNLKALHQLLPEIELSGIEINKKAHDQLIHFKVDYQRELSLIKGVFIHINPDELQDVYQKLYEASSKYIVIAKYYNPTPVELSYRGHSGKLFKRDFADEFLKKFQGVRLLNYGFAYHGDYLFPQDDITWFLLKK